MIRLARTTDHPAIAEVNASAFDREDEAQLVSRLRAQGDVLFELVSETDGAMEGHILFSRLWADRDALYAALAPMAVRPGAQRTGIGSDLVRKGLEYAKEFGAHAVIVLGHPDYYPRFGFTTAAASKIQAPYSGLPAFMALELEEGALSEPLVVAYPDAFSG